jgi:arylsulfatase A-like enzyme
MTDDRANRELDRRTFLKRGLLAGGLMSTGGLTAGLIKAATGPGVAAAARPRLAHVRPGHEAKPNILVIVVDQLRSAPSWLSRDPIDARQQPNIARLARGGVSFGSHYTASNDCTPARSTLLTGLYTHQTGCMITGGSTLNPEFPTWGTLLREHGYQTWWFGKWHLTRGDNKWQPGMSQNPLERYGFSGGTFPSPDGAPGQGWRVDPMITTQFEQWLSEAPEGEPWCTTVSLVNPHDIAWWYLWSDRFAPESTAPKVTGDLPPNFETPESMLARHKPSLQHSFQEISAASFGPVPYSGPDVRGSWLPFLDLYAKLQGEVDSHVGTIMASLASRPNVAANTVVLFTSDHGEYGAAHGMRGKGASAYEEAIRVPLIVNDRRGVLTKAPKRVRRQLTSSVDIVPMLLTIASGSNEWRADPRFAHLARRADLTRMLGDPAAPGRPYVLHATDEIVTEFAIEPYAASAPLHVVGLRTAKAKYCLYSNWEYEGTTPISKGEQSELYDYSSRAGRLELDNVVGRSRLEEQLRPVLEEAFEHELRGALPSELVIPQLDGFANYFASVERAAKTASRRREATERIINSAKNLAQIR